MNQIFIVNMSVDVWDFYPVAFNQIKTRVAEFLRQEKSRQG
ncbi:MAG TPA: hypothetical protein PK263_04150 [bacterium]|jgi:hypothetical protein|nr:hypothetical protein [bacterium]